MPFYTHRFTFPRWNIPFTHAHTHTFVSRDRSLTEHARGAMIVIVAIGAIIIISHKPQVAIARWVGARPQFRVLRVPCDHPTSTSSGAHRRPSVHNILDSRALSNNLAQTRAQASLLVATGLTFQTITLPARCISILYDRSPLTTPTRTHPPATIRV